MPRKKKVENKLPPGVAPRMRNLSDDEKQRIMNGLSEAIFGFNPQGWGEQLSQVTTLFKNNRWYLVTNMRQPLNEIYVEHGLIQTVVDVPVDDGLRGGVDITSKQLSTEQIQDLTTEMERQNDLGVVGQALKWNRLFGGSGIIIVTDQDPETPLDVDAITEDSKFALMAVDMWELFWTQQNVGDNYGQLIDGSTPAYDNTADVEFYNYYGVKLHKSRVMIIKGITAPSLLRPKLRGWGLSVVESFIRSINQYLKATDLTFEVLDEFKVDVYKIKNLANALLSQEGTANIHRRVQIANQQKNFQNAITMDSEDDFISKELTFAGIAETMQGIRMQIASDLRMPLTKVFGISAAGFSSGEDDIENYNAMIESTIRQKCKFYILSIIEMRCQKMFGFRPDDLTIAFKPLRMLTAEQEENVKTSKFNRLTIALEKGVIDAQTFREACNKDNLLGVQLDATDTDLYKAETDEEEAGNAAGKNPESTLTAPKAKNDLVPGVPRITCVALTCDGYVLTGQRKDNGKWTFPGGHLEAFEPPLEGAYRECQEECGIDMNLSESQALPEIRVQGRSGRLVDIYPFVVKLRNRQFPKTTDDPDHEISVWRWVKIDPKSPELMPEARHAKKDVLVERLLKDMK